VITPADTLPDDPGLLKAMLIAERIESERLRQIIRTPAPSTACTSEA
jgi:hypothetical protein